MTSIRQSYLFSVLVAVTVLPLDASNLLTLRQSNDPAASLKKCLKHLEKQQTGGNSRSVFLRKMSPDDICGNLLDNLLTRIQLLPDQHSEIPFGSGKIDPRLFSDVHAAGGVLYPNLGPGLYAKFDSTKPKKNIPHKLATIRSTPLEDLPNDVGLNSPDMPPVPKDFLLDHPSDLIQNVPVAKNSLKTRNSLLNQLVENGNFQRGEMYNDGGNYYNDNDDEIMQTLNEQASPLGRISPSKRAAGDWFNLVSTEVAKRRRQTLSINNALMALTDMVMEHGREKLMRNRENLRYHMYVQG